MAPSLTELAVSGGDKQQSELQSQHFHLLLCDLKPVILCLSFFLGFVDYNRDVSINTHWTNGPAEAKHVAVSGIY